LAAGRAERGKRGRKMKGKRERGKGIAPLLFGDRVT